MARPRKYREIDLSKPHALTVGLIEALRCPEGRIQAFLRDSITRGLRVRVTETGNKAFIYEGKLDNRTIRKTIGDVSSITIEEARKRARGLALVVLTDKQDPRELERQRKRAKAEAEEEAKRRAEFTFESLMADYANQLEKLGRSSSGKVRGIFKKHLSENAPELARTPAAQVTAEQVTDLLRSLNDAGKTRTAGKLRSYARAAFEMARTVGTDSELPVRFKSYAVKHNPAAETKAIQRHDDKNPLHKIHLRQYWEAIKPMQGLKGAVLRFHLLTGAQRIEQLCSLVISNVGSDCVTFHDGKGRAGKKPRAHPVPLIPAARIALDELLALANDGDYLLSINNGRTPLSAATFSRWAQEAASGVNWQEGGDIPSVGLFQAKRLRSGVETTLSSYDVSRDDRGHLLSHGVAGVQAASYDGHDYISVKRRALETLFRHLENTSASVTHLSFDRKAA
jgi:integrase